MSVYLVDGAVVISGGNIGTTEDCCCIIGACCHESGVCTQEQEVNCDGTYQGDGSLCDPNPCVGACCGEDGGCTITTEADCTGTFQGAGTVCDPNPCAPCSCGFPEFIPSDPPIYYLVKTYHFVRTATTSGSPNCDSSIDWTTTKTVTVGIDGSCTMNTVCAGTNDTTIEFQDPCHSDWVLSGTHEHDDDLLDLSGGCHEDDPCEACNGTACTGGTLIPVSATEAELICHSEGVNHTTDLTYRAVLSSPFDCGGFSPPPISDFVERIARMAGY